MITSSIIKNQAQIFECAKSFRQDANQIMKELSTEYNFSLEATETFPREIYRHKYNNKGIFKNEWIYFFHGVECRFDNMHTGQIIELIYSTKPEFGFLDGYFFFNYMATTERFKQLAKWFGDYMNVWTAMDVLADAGILTRDLQVRIRRNIIAL